VVSHQSWYFDPGTRPGFTALIKLNACRFVHNVCASHAIAAALRVPSKVVPDAYRSAIFHPRGDVARDRDLIFVGRLVSDKGADLLVHALKRLEGRGLRPSLTIVGDGVERGALGALCASLCLGSAPDFVGWKTPAQTAKLLCRHKILVVPSRWQEPFGIVALEGIACGCAVVGSSGGGLPEAIGPCGALFPNGDAAALAEALHGLLSDSAQRESLAANAVDHLPRFDEAGLVREYLALLDAIHHPARTGTWASP
jgi:glycosyltransferase involved in cell wall biosynthesis